MYVRRNNFIGGKKNLSMDTCYPQYSAANLYTMTQAQAAELASVDCKHTWWVARRRFNHFMIRSVLLRPSVRTDTKVMSTCNYSSVMSDFMTSGLTQPERHGVRG